MITTVHRRLRAALRSRWKRWVGRTRPDADDGRDADRSDGAPTFADLVAGRRDWLFEHLPPDAAEYHYDLFGKNEQKRLARHLGLPVAREYLRNATLDEAFGYVRAHGLDSFVVKPETSRSGIGCACAVRQGDGFLDLRSGRRAGLERLQAFVAAEYARLDRPDEWMLEELLMPADGSMRRVDDFKVYCFGGVAELIAQKRNFIEKGFLGRRKPVWRSRWYTRDWTPVDMGMPRERVDASLRPPPDAERLVEMAEGAASRLCLPFIRMDMYDTVRGPVLGELTPGPGARRVFSSEWDAYLCRRWREAEEALERGLASGEIEPLRPEDAPSAVPAAPPDAPARS